jgi:hypothetical protein
MLDYFKKLIDTSNTLSSNRFAFLFTTIISNVLFWLTWAGVSAFNREIVDVPPGVYIIYGLANGIVGLGKFGQNITEIKAEPKQ